MPTVSLLLGNPNFKAEVLRAYEGGYRQRMSKVVSVDLAGFFNVYSKLRDRVSEAPYVVISSTPTLVVPILYVNGVDAHTHGVEAALSWTPTRVLRIQGSYAWANAHLRNTDGQSVSQGDTWSSPTNALSVRGNWGFASRWNLYSAIYSVSKLETASSSIAYPVNSYERLDMHVSYNVLRLLQFSAGGDNLLQDHHPELDSNDGYSSRSQVPRNGFVKVVWSF
jgi:iron complex outermembrane receptor protein